ncbi:GNAT family N-acetyltransferase [Paenibacillus polymyxa]|uniref:GNAT family N-acetyltransferase n=1 Tax=Paenibacillus polymyxa TaxID=1406 RepID=UPI0008C79E7C|nr:GNAT family N-acetyltransferase [Paenibacillus polymyxa]SEK03879.1 Acetyltransferase (GNAT) family protein [Paenibacillus polymyxa]
MISHRLLTYEIIYQLTDLIHRDQYLLFYSYLTQRKEQAKFVGQYVDDKLTGVLAYFCGLSFPAFSFHCINREQLNFLALIAFTEELIQLKKNTVCGTILCDRDLQLFQSHGLVTGNPQRFLTMKHMDQSKLLDSNVAELVKGNDISDIVDLLRNGGMKFFTSSELEQYPFLGIKENGHFIAAGGFHFYDSKLVELGNIYTSPAHRGKGLAKHLTSQLTKLGRTLSSDVYLGVLEENQAAVQLYKGLGYEVTAEQTIVDFKLSID